jgi:hypothetical protein
MGGWTLTRSDFRPRFSDGDGGGSGDVKEDGNGCGNEVDDDEDEQQEEEAGKGATELLSIDMPARSLPERRANLRRPRLSVLRKKPRRDRDGVSGEI